MPLICAGISLDTSHFIDAVNMKFDVLIDPDGLPHVLAIAVPMLMFLAGWVERIILRCFYFQDFFTRALLHD